MVIDVILPAVLVSPKQLLVRWYIWFKVSMRIITQKRSWDLLRQLLNAMVVMSDLVMWNWAPLRKPRLKVDMIMFIWRLIKMSKFRDPLDRQVVLDSRDSDFRMVSLFSNTMLNLLLVLAIWVHRVRSCVVGVV